MQTLKENGIVNENELAELNEKVHDEVERAARFADESPEPAVEELYTQVYANPISPGKK